MPPLTSEEKNMTAFDKSGLIDQILRSVTAIAATLTYSGTGRMSPVGLPVGDILPLIVITPTTACAFSNGRTRQLQALFTSDLRTGAGNRTFNFFTGTVSVFGTIAANGNLATGQFLLSYAVFGGTGGYQGFAGTGSSTVQLLGDPFSPPTPYSESGSLNVAQAPEPAAFAPVALALLDMLSRGRKARVFEHRPPYVAHLVGCNALEAPARR
jgi:hypothetical protein